PYLERRSRSIACRTPESSSTASKTGFAMTCYSKLSAPLKTGFRYPIAGSDPGPKPIDETTRALLDGGHGIEDHIFAKSASHNRGQQHGVVCRSRRWTGYSDGANRSDVLCRGQSSGQPSHAQNSTG